MPLFEGWNRASAGAKGAAIPLLCTRNYAKPAPDGTGLLVRRSAMDDHGQVEYATATGNDYAAHVQTYRHFVTLVKSVIGVVVVILILLAYFLV
jgi:hypothetical protein